MAYSLKRKEPLSFVTNSQTLDSSEKKKREISISFGQLCALWGVVAVMMVIVFFFGVHAGLDQGLKRALDEQDTATLRYPLPATKAPAEQTASLPTNGAGILAQDGFSAEPKAGASLPKEEEKFDFSGVTTSAGSGQAGSGAPTAGLAGRTAAEILDAPAATTSKLQPKNELAGSISALEQDLASRQADAKIAAPVIDPAPVVEDERDEAIAKVEKLAEKPLEKPAPVKQEVARVTVKADAKAEAAAKLQVAKAEAARKAELKAEAAKSAATQEKFRPGHYVQVAAPTSRGESEAILRKLNRLGMPGRIVEGRVNGVLYYRVMVGPEGSRAGAEKLRSRVVRSGISGSQPFIKQLPAS